MKLPSEKLQGIPVKKYMASKVMTFLPELAISDAIEMLVQYRYTGAPVVDLSGTLVGMLSEKDCLRVAVRQGNVGEALVGEYMTKAVESVTPDASLFDVAEKFTNAQYKRLPVVENGKLVGQISRADILRAIKELMHSNK